MITNVPVHHGQLVEAGQLLLETRKHGPGNRLVQKGQALLAIVDPASEWELEMSVPECPVSYILEAVARSAKIRSK